MKRHNQRQVPEGGILVSVSADYFRPEQAPTHDDDRIRVAGIRGIAEYAGGRVRLTGPGGYTEPVLQASQDVFELFVRRVNGEKTGIGAEESFYLNRIVLQARDCALAGGGQRIMGSAAHASEYSIRRPARGIREPASGIPSGYFINLKRAKG